MISSTTVRVRDFFQQHTKGLSFVGALIVFSTFVVREGIRERFKDLSDSISSAESVFETRADVNELPIYLAYLDYRIGTLDAKLNVDPKSNPSFTLATMRETVDLMVQNSKRAGTAIENLQRTIQTLGNDRSINTKLSEITNDTALWKSRSDFVQNSAIAANRAQPPQPDRITQIISKANEVNAALTNLRYDKIVPLQTELVSFAENKRAHYQKLFDLSTWASYLLYLVGWGLALAGRMFSVEVLVGGQ